MSNYLNIHKSPNSIVNLHAFRGFDDPELYDFFSSRDVFQYQVDPDNVYYWMEVVVRRKASKRELINTIDKSRKMAIEIAHGRQQKIMLSFLLMQSVFDLFNVDLLVGMDGSVGDFLRMMQQGSLDLVLFNNFGYDNRGARSGKKEIIDSLRSVSRVVAPNIAKMYKFESIALDSEESVKRFVNEHGIDFICRVIHNAEAEMGGIQIGAMRRRLQQTVSAQVAAYR